MASKESIIEKIQQVADADGDAQMKIGMGTPGSTVENVIKELQKTGQAWIATPSTLAIMMEGIARATERIYVTLASENISTFEAGSIIEFGDDNKTITLDDPMLSIGKFIIKGKNKIGQNVIGTIDGIEWDPEPWMIENYDVLRIYSNGSGWFSW